MHNIKQVNNDIAVATQQVTPEQLQQAAQQGFKSVLNLRSPDEEDFVTDEQQQAEALGLEYVNIPVKPQGINAQLTDEILQQIDALPKPALIHCKSGMRAGAMALMNVATRSGMTPEQAFAKAQEIGFDCNSNPQMKQFFAEYVSTHSQTNQE